MKLIDFDEKHHKGHRFPASFIQQEYTRTRIMKVLGTWTLEIAA